MILLRWGVKRGFLLQKPPFYMKMSTDESKLTERKERVNPLKNRPYVDIVKLTQKGITKKNEIAFYRLVLEDALERSQSGNNHKGAPYAETNAKQKLMNTVFGSMIANLEVLSVQDIYLLVRFYFISQDNQFCKLSAQNKKFYKRELQDRIKLLVEKDKFGDHRKIFKEMLYRFFASKKLFVTLKQVINYLGEHEIKNNTEMLRFFQSIAPVNKTGYYDEEIQKFIIRYMNPRQNNLKNAKEWVKPIAFQMLRLFTLGQNFQGNKRFVRFINGLKHLFSRNQLELKDQIQLFRSLLEWSRFEYPSLLNVGDYNECVNLIYQMMKHIKSRMNGDLLSIQQLYAVLQSSNNYNNFAYLTCGLFKKPYDELLQQFVELTEYAIQYQIVQHYKRFTPECLVMVISFNYNFSLCRKIEQMFVKTLIKILSEAEDTQGSIITRLRIYEYLAKAIKQNNYTEQLNDFLSILKNIEGKYQSLKQYEIIRIYHIYKVFNIPSPVLEEIFNFTKQKKEPVVIENLARTCLKPYSLPLILGTLDQLKQKYYSLPNYTATVLPVIWSSCKNFKKQVVDSNRDQVFKYWIHDNRQYFNDLTKSHESCYVIHSTAIKQLYLNAKGARNSLNYELLLEVIYSQIQQNKMQFTPNLKASISENIKNFIQSKNITQILAIQYRHSFFVKLMWAFLLFPKYRVGENYSKRLRKTKQSHLIMKSIFPSIYRDRPNIKNMLLLRYVNNSPTSHDFKIRLYAFPLNRWTWANYHDMNWTYQKNFIESLQFQNFIQSNIGAINRLEYCLWIGKNEDEKFKIYLEKSRVPAEIVEGTLTRDTQIKQNIILDLLPSRNTLEYLFKQYPLLADNFILKITNIQFPPLEVKLVEAANLVNKVKQLLTPSVYFSFKQWIYKSLKHYPPTNQLLFARMWIYFNHSTPETQLRIKQYAKNQLREGNIYLASLLYINGYNDLEVDVIEFLNLVNRNHIMPFLQDFNVEKVVLLNSMLGLALNQNSKQALDLFIDLFLAKSKAKICFNQFDDDKYQVLHQFYILLSVAENRLDIQQGNRKVVKDFRYSLKKMNEKIELECLKEIRQRTQRSINKFGGGLNLEKDAKTQFPIMEGKLVLVDNEEPGHTRNVQSYIKMTFGIAEIRVCKEMDLQNLKAASSS